MDTSCEIGFTCAILLYASAILLSAADQLQYLDGTLTILTVKMVAFEPLSEAKVTVWQVRLSCHPAHQAREY